MKKLLLFLLLLSSFLFAYVDSDMDGVEDKDDLCPNTLMLDLVNLQGCTIKSLLSPHHFSLMAGFNYAKDNNTSYNFSSMEFSYSYKKLSLQLSTSYYTLETDAKSSEGLNDTNLNLLYRLMPLNNFTLSLGGGIAFPTYDSSSNKTDYSLFMYGNYTLDKWALLGGVGYRFIGDSNASNTLFYNLSAGYNWSTNVYSSLGYYFSKSIYEEVDGFESLSWYNYYRINKNWFGTLTLTQGLNSQSLDNSMGVKLGYSW